MPLLVKVIALKETLVVISRVVTPIVQTLESMRIKHSSCSSLSRRIELGIGLATLSQQSVVPKTSLSLTTTMVNPEIPKISNKNPTLPPGLQDSSQHVGESSESLNLISRTSSRASK